MTDAIERASNLRSQLDPDSGELFAVLRSLLPLAEAAKGFVETWGNSGLATSLVDDYDCTLTCAEADAFAAMFAAFGYRGTAETIVQAHAEHDEPGDAHFIGPMEAEYYWPPSLHRYDYTRKAHVVNLRKAQS